MEERNRELRWRVGGGEEKEGKRRRVGGRGPKRRIWSGEVEARVEVGRREEFEEGEWHNGERVTLFL